MSPVSSKAGYQRRQLTWCSVNGIGRFKRTLWRQSENKSGETDRPMRALACLKECRETNHSEGQLSTALTRRRQDFWGWVQINSHWLDPLSQSAKPYPLQAALSFPPPPLSITTGASGCSFLFVHAQSLSERLLCCVPNKPRHRHGGSFSLLPLFQVCRSFSLSSPTFLNARR